MIHCAARGIVRVSLCHVDMLPLTCVLCVLSLMSSFSVSASAMPSSRSKRTDSMFKNACFRTLSLSGTWRSLIQDLPPKSVSSNLQSVLQKLGSLEDFSHHQPFVQNAALKAALGEGSELLEQIMEVIYHPISVSTM